MVSVPVFNRRFTPSLRMSILALLTLSLFTFLGFWQLSRAQEKRHLLALAAHFKNLPVQAWSAGAPLPKPYQHINLVGHFTMPLFFLDNQHYNHAFGYHIITPFQLENNLIVMVDRGFVEGDVTRESWPLITTKQGIQSLQGVVYYPRQSGWFLGPVLDSTQINGVVIERVDVKFLSQFLHKTVYPFIMRVENADENALALDWPVVSMPPERHVAYAIQWFAMAFVALILFLGLNYKKIS